MTTLYVRRRFANQLSRWLNLGGEPSEWVVSDGAAELATARMRLLRYELDMELEGRSLIARVPQSALAMGVPTTLEVLDDATAHPVVDGKLVTGGRTPTGNFGEEWIIEQPNRPTITWIRRPEDAASPRKLGFYAADGSLVMTVGHDASFQVAGNPGTFRVLLTFWAAAAQSRDRYVAQLADGAIDRLIARADVPMFALLGVFMERTGESRYASVR